MEVSRDMLRITMKKLHQTPISYYPIHAKMMGGVAGGVALSQLMYWYGTTEGERFFKTDKELKEETGLSEYELKEAKKTLKTLPFLTVTIEGLPAKTFYEIDIVLYFENLHSWANSPEPV